MLHTLMRKTTTRIRKKAADEALTVMAYNDAGMSEMQRGYN